MPYVRASQEAIDGASEAPRMPAMEKAGELPGYATAAVLGQQRGEGDGDGEERDATELHEQELAARVPESRGAPGESEDDHQVEEHEGRDAGSNAGEQSSEGG